MNLNQIHIQRKLPHHIHPIKAVLRDAYEFYISNYIPSKRKLAFTTSKGFKLSIKTFAEAAI